MRSFAEFQGIWPQFASTPGPQNSILRTGKSVFWVALQYVVYHCTARVTTFTDKPFREGVIQFYIIIFLSKNQFAASCILCILPLRRMKIF